MMAEQTQTKTRYSVSVIIVNYNGGDDVAACLGSVMKSDCSDELEVIVVDNGSSDGSQQRIKREFAEVELIELGENKGFAAGCNAGIGAAHAGTILLLNPDTEVSVSAISRMHSALSEHPHWGIAGARMRDGKGDVYRAARRFPKPRDLSYQATGMARLFSSSKKFNGYLYGERKIEELDEVEQVEGSCLMISAAAREKVGLLDERFFIFFEEVDWCKRVKDAGYEIHVVNNAEVSHKVSTTMGKYYEFTRAVHAQSAMKYFRKHEGEEGYRAIRTVMTKALLLRAVILALPALLGIGNARRRFTGALIERRAYAVGIE